MIYGLVAAVQDVGGPVRSQDGIHPGVVVTVQNGG